MKTFIIAAATLAAVVGFAASANAQHRTAEGAAIGAGTGLVVAGPPGAVVGGVIGAVVGGPKFTRYHGHRVYVEGSRHYYWDHHHRHYY